MSPISIAEAIDLLVDEEIGVAHSRDADRPQHLTSDDFDVLVVDGNGLRAVELMDLVDQVALQFLDTVDGRTSRGSIGPFSRRRASHSADRRRGHARLPAR